ncbi:uncharacterized protein LOC119166653 isoform X4 [Rhipicephalus microplus]|uniref:uncharacterized protein LOC119166653 isoform X4 n=1 Tax=Rhipicephalus microplus TaxID=6941 RepID=UPI003F6AABDB
MRIPNHFVFLVQFLLGLLFPPCTSATGKPFLVSATRKATNSHVPETVARIALDYQRHQYSSTLTDSGACAHPWSPLADQPISSSPRSAAAIGHGGTLAMRIPNHFVFLVQGPPTTRNHQYRRLRKKTRRLGSRLLIAAALGPRNRAREGAMLGTEQHHDRAAAVVPSPGLNMEHGFLRKIEENQIQRHYQFKEDVMRRTETAKLARRVGLPNKSPKPTIEIYRPPGVRVSDLPQSSEDMALSPTDNGSHHHHHHHHQTVLMNGTNGTEAPSQPQPAAPRAVHFQVPLSSLPSSTKEVVGKSSLRRSKSFSHEEPANACFPAEYQSLVKKAMHDPNTLSSHQLMELVRAICQRATEGIQNAEPSAQLCLSIIAKERGETFLESMLSACRELFNERDQLLRPLDATMVVPRRWTAYVCFLAELLLGLRGRISTSCPTGGRGTASRTLCLVMLLCDCCHIILRPPSLGNPAEMECLRSVLTIAGRAVERDAPQRMAILVGRLREAFVQPGLSAQTRKTLLELLELHASGWQLNLAQQLYYFPYTSLEHRK